MLIALTFAAALAGQAAPHAPAPHGPASHAPVPTDIRREVRVFTLGGPDGGPGVGGPGMDRNNDGFVTRDEFIAPQTAAFDMLDADKDGRISAEEFASGRAAAHVILAGSDGRGGRGGPDGNVRFQIGGRDGPGPMGDGRVMLFRHGGPGDEGGPGGPGGPGAPGDLDADHDGKVSEAEFLAPMREAFQRMDADRSGVLEAGEHGRGGAANTFIIRRGDPGAPPAN